ncbi:insulin-like growth factor-binding protein complex acid labile subunit [Lytechinus variegatus]|uniref:insulin-like growth factor-binding protein complex acid labile subunit n=1 Tax=Lytechinus variegatus TaxID=7654 RepID=UPI001BB27843|nr:insulin-like growth factor-binding protein complex acid labile subunit [Lytechinus variegatus]
MFSSNSLSLLNAASSNLETFPGDVVELLTSSTILSLSSNRIRNINWTSSNPLNSLYLDSNSFRQISNESFVLNNPLDTLDLSTNPLEFIEATVIASLNIKRIYLMNTHIALNQIRNFFHGISLSTYIEELNLSDTELHAIQAGLFTPLKGKSLAKVNIELNDINVIEDGGFDGLGGVNQLQLGWNNLKLIKPNIFKGMTALRYLSLDKNRIVTLNEDAVPWNVSLIELNLASNEIISINSSAFHGLKTLRKLDLSENHKLQLIESDSFASCPFIAELDLSNTHIFHLHFPYLPFLTSLILQYSFCPDKLIRPGNLETKAPSLSTLNLIDNILGSEKLWDSSTNKSSFYGLQNLSRLELSSNPLLSIPPGIFKNLSNLQILRLDDCLLVVLETGIFSDLSHLILLSMQSNHLRAISTGLFDKLQDLQYLFLPGNEFTYLDGNVFQYLSNLVFIDISKNRISGLNHSTFRPLSNLRKLYLSDNPIVCNCDLKWFPVWLKGGNVELIDSFETICLDTVATLKQFRGKQLITFNPTGDCDANIVLYSCLAVVGMVSIFTLGLIYYQRWWIRYRLFLLKLCFVGYEVIHDDADREEYQYDLAVMLHEADDEWVDQHLRPALIERLPDFNRIVCGDEELMLGMYYLDAVHYATERSFKTIFVISRAALQDQWFLMKFRTVLDHVNDVGTEKMVIVFVEDIGEDELPFLIRLFLSDHRPYLIWPGDERGQYYFWEELTKGLTVNLKCNQLIPPN